MLEFADALLRATQQSILAPDGARRVSRWGQSGGAPPGAANLGAWSHAIVRQGGSGCPQCVELAVAVNSARSDVGYWRALHREALERESKLKQQLEQLEGKLKLRERQLFGHRSERKGKGKGNATRPGEAKPEGRRKRGQQRGARGHGRRRQEELPVQPETHDLAEEDECCPKCQLPLQPVGGTEDSEVIEIEVRAYRRRIQRKRYRRSCKCPGETRIITAPAPGKLVPKGMLGVSVWVLLLLDKFLFQRPTYRLLLDLQLHQLHLAQGTVTDGLKRFSPLFEPLYAALIARNVSLRQICGRETTAADLLVDPGAGLVAPCPVPSIPLRPASWLSRPSEC